LKLLNPSTAVTSRGVWDAATDEQLKQGRNQSSSKHWAATLIALNAVSRVDVFVTSEPDLMNLVKLEVEKGRLKLKVGTTRSS
jgi:hypothetical protein